MAARYGHIAADQIDCQLCDPWGKGRGGRMCIALDLDCLVIRAAEHDVAIFNDGGYRRCSRDRVDRRFQGR